MLHILYRIKCMLKSKELIFWSLLFPILLGIMFNFAFGSINKQFEFLQIEVGILNYDENDPLITVLENVSSDEDENMFIINRFEDEELAMKALKDEKINAVIDFQNNYSMTVMNSNIQENIIKSVLDEYIANSRLVKEVAVGFYEKNDIAGFEKYIESMINGMEVRISEIPLKGSDKDPFTQYFFALLAMTCLIASQPGLELCNKIQPDLSVIGARRNVSSKKKMTQLLYDFIATYFIYCIIVTFVVFLCKYGFKRDFGDQLLLVLIATYIGTFTGMTTGTAISVWTKGNTNIKATLCTVFFMLSSFLAGLQWGDIVYHIEKNCPIINRINPGTLIVNAYSSLTVYGDVKQYTINIMTLLFIGIVFLALSILKLRREKYANI